MKLKKLLEVLNPGEEIYVITGESKSLMFGTVESFLSDDIGIPGMYDLLNAKVVYVYAADKGHFSIAVHLKGDKND
jgi:hypothetical protein